MGIGLAIAAAAVAVAGAISAGNSKKNAAHDQATLLNQDAQTQLLISQQEERDYRRGSSAMMGTRRAGLGAQGVTQEGTPALVDENVVSDSELQALRIRTGGQAQAMRTRQQAVLTAKGGRAEQTASYFRAGSIILSAASSAYGGMSGAGSLGAGLGSA